MHGAGGRQLLDLGSDPMSTYIDRAEAERLAKRAPQRGFMPPASAIEISLPDISASIAEIRRYSAVPWKLRDKYHQLRGTAFVYGSDPHWQEAEDALDEVLASKRAHDLQGIDLDDVPL
jgi:hypothetical protein